jgi:rubrerythrin
MSRYIDADQIVYWIRHTSRDGLEDDVRRVAFKDAIERIPTADVQEVKHAKWLTYRFGLEVVACSNCGAVYEGGDSFRFCPKCGAKMGWEEEK